jgi:protein-disulfide isomerase
VAQNNSAALVISALIIGSSIVAGSLLVKRAVDRTGGEVAALKETIQSASAGGAAAQRGREAAAPGRPDPNRRYAVNTKGAPSRGNSDAKIAVVEFSDFQCPYCGRAVATLGQIQQQYGDKVRIVFKNLPLPMHAQAPAAHAAAEAAHRQGKFWEMHDKIFADQANMSPERYREYAREIGLDLARFDRDVADASTRERIDADAAEAKQLGISGTPAFFVNGRFVEGAVPFETFRKLIDEELGKA